MVVTEKCRCGLAALEITMDYEKMIVGMTVARDTIPPEFAAFIRTTLPDELPKRLAEEQERREHGDDRWPD